MGFNGQRRWERNNMETDGNRYGWFDPKIRGLNALLAQKRGSAAGEEAGFRFERTNGLNMAVCGPAGVGKTILAMQMAVAAAGFGQPKPAAAATGAAAAPAAPAPTGSPGAGQDQDRWKVVYFTKDTPPRVQLDQMKKFQLFQEKGFPAQQGELEKTPVAAPSWAPAVTLGEGGNAERAVFVLLDDLMDELSHKDTSKAEAAETQFRKIWKEQAGLIALASFTEVPVGMAKLDRYAIASTPYEALGYFQPGLRPVFDIIKQVGQDQGKKRGADRTNLFVVCDSLSPRTLEHHLKARAHFARSRPDREAGKEALGPIFLFVMESSELPEAMAVSFPPDMQIALRIRPEAHGVNTRTIRLVKTRFQKSLDEETPFVILGPPDHASVAMHRVIRPRFSGMQGKGERVGAPQDEEPQPFAGRNPGIEILPPIAHEPLVAPQRDVGNCNRKVRFHIKGLDNDFTEERSLAGGGCTLLVTQNQCGSTALSLHYLLAQIADKAAGGGRAEGAREEAKEAKPPNSVLFISFSGDVTDLLHTIWRHKLLRHAIWDAKGSGPAPPGPWAQPELPYGAWVKSGLTPAAAWAQLEESLNVGLSAAAQDASGSAQPRHRLFMIKLRHEMQRPCYLHIYIPDFTWVTPEEAMERVARLLQPDDVAQSKAARVERVVLDRVGRLQARWPLIENQNVFISGVVALCAQNGAELMLIDDTAEGREFTGLFHSRWVGVAQNIIRLRRVPFHGGETRTIELLKATGRIVTAKRPGELVFNNDGTGFGDSMSVEDSFRGYMGLSIGRPERCKLDVDLTYDEEHTPLYRDALAAKAKIEATVDGVSVRPVGPATWSGINSAFNNLSSVSRDICRIVAIDGIWLGSLLRRAKLHRLTRDELLTILPKHISKPLQDMQPLTDIKIEDWLDQHYVTQSLTTAIAAMDKAMAADLGKGFFYAVPMRHNWGLLAVSRPTDWVVRQVFRDIAATLQKPGNGDDMDRGAIVQRILDGKAAEAPAKGSPGVSNEWAERRELFEKAARVVLGLLCKGAEPGGNEPIPRIWRKVWKNARTPVSYDELADFRTDYWHYFWRGGWVERTLSRMTIGNQGMEVDLWDALFPRIDFFGLSVASLESAVSFLLELVLAYANQSDLFEDAEDRMLKFSNKPACKSGFAQALRVFYRLLSINQRRRIAIGLPTGQEGGDFPLHNRLVAVSQYHEGFKDWPSQICLFSREWITTVKDLQPDYDVRERVDLAPLPTGATAACLDYWKSLLADKANVKARPVEEFGGPTLAGTWYLGVLRGGNTDLAKDVMREILSEDHELERLLNRCSGPVSTKFYEQNREARTVDAPASGDSGGGLPYMDIISELYAEREGAATGQPDQGTSTSAAHAQDLGRSSQVPSLEQPGNAVASRGKPPTDGGHGKPHSRFFPFYRTRIVNYQEVSSILMHLIRQVMSADEEAQTLRSNATTSKNNQLVSNRTEWEKNVENLASMAVEKVVIAQKGGDQ